MGITLIAIGAASTMPPATLAQYERPFRISRNPSSKRYSFQIPTCPRCRQFSVGNKPATSVTAPSHGNHRR